MLISQVKYDATNFLEKNRDTLSPDIIHVLRSSGKELVILHVNCKDFVLPVFQFVLANV